VATCLRAVASKRLSHYSKASAHSSLQTRPQCQGPTILLCRSGRSAHSSIARRLASETLLEPLAAQGLCELRDHEARLTPGQWECTGPANVWIRYLDFFVSNAPAGLRRPDALKAVDPASFYDQHISSSEGRSVTIHSAFDGVFSGHRHRGLRENMGEVPTGVGPFEVKPPWHTWALPGATISGNLAFLRTSPGLAEDDFSSFRAFASALSLQTYTTRRRMGRWAFLFANTQTSTA